MATPEETPIADTKAEKSIDEAIDKALKNIGVRVDGIEEGLDKVSSRVSGFADLSKDRFVVIVDAQKIAAEDRVALRSEVSAVVSDVRSIRSEVAGQKDAIAELTIALAELGTGSRQRDVDALKEIKAIGAAFVRLETRNDEAHKKLDTEAMERHSALLSAIGINEKADGAARGQLESYSQIDARHEAEIQAVKARAQAAEEAIVDVRVAALSAIDGAKKEYRKMFALRTGLVVGVAMGIVEVARLLLGGHL